MKVKTITLTREMYGISSTYQIIYFISVQSDWSHWHDQMYILLNVFSSWIFDARRPAYHKYINHSYYALSFLVINYTCTWSENKITKSSRFMRNQCVNKWYLKRSNILYSSFNSSCIQHDLLGSHDHLVNFNDTHPSHRSSRGVEWRTGSIQIGYFP